MLALAGVGGRKDMVVFRSVGDISLGKGLKGMLGAMKLPTFFVILSVSFIHHRVVLQKKGLMIRPESWADIREGILLMCIR